jgi:hypothetical protein
MTIKKYLLVGLLSVVVGLPSAAAAGSLAKAAARGATKSVTRAWRGTAAKTLRRDLLRDRATRVRSLVRDRTVFRYTTKTQARQEIRKGIQSGSHLTARATAGRPLSLVRAQRRYGLPQRPEVRETIRVPKGQPVRLNRVVGGAAGIGELTSSRRVPPGAIEKVVPLH